MSVADCRKVATTYWQFGDFAKDTATPLRQIERIKMGRDFQ
jgi:hypothetical protein